MNTSPEETVSLLADYECDSCGACCAHLIVEAELEDVLREPRLLEADIGNEKRGRPLSLSDMILDEKVVLLACVVPCAFLEDQADGTRTCGIYPTRPGSCVLFPAGSEQCQRSRFRAGLSPLVKKVKP